MTTKKVAPKAATVKELLATSGMALRSLREKGVVLTFPSENNYRVCLPGAAGMLKRGNLPNPLLSFVVDAFYNGPSQSKWDAFLSPKDKEGDALALLASLKVVCEAMFMEPRVVDEPSAPDECSIEDIPMADRVWAFRLLFAPVNEVQPFRGQQETHVASIPEPQDVPATAQQ